MPMGLLLFLFVLFFFLIGFILLISSRFTSSISPFVVFLILLAIYSDQIELDLSNGEMIRKILWIPVMKINIHNIKKYFLEYRGRTSGYFLSQGNHIEMEIFENGETRYNKIFTLIEKNDVRKLFFEIQNNNKGLSESTIPFKRDILRKKISSVYGFVLLIAAIIFAIYMLLIKNFINS